MASLAFTPMAYRYVVFPDAPGGNGHAVNLSPHPPDSRPVVRQIPELCASEYSGLQWLFKRACLELSDYRPETLKRRIPSCLRALRLESLQQVCLAVERQPDLLRPAISTLVIGVTSFFRDPQVFLALQQTGIDEVLSRASNPRIWSAGCSDGAELYSVAMLLAERGDLQKCTFLGTDCRADAIPRAREGCYDLAALKSVPGELIQRYFQSRDTRWQISPSVRSVSQWRQGNAMRTSEPGTWDMILCRNLAIYLQPAAAGRLWARLSGELRPGGLLVTGKAERPYGAEGLRCVAPCIYQRTRS